MDLHSFLSHRRANCRGLLGANIEESTPTLCGIFIVTVSALATPQLWQKVQMEFLTTYTWLDTAKLWAQVTHLRISDYVCNYRQAADIFEGCPKLVWLSLRVSVNPAFFNVARPPIILHNMSFLSLATNSFSAILELIYLPSLREISVQETPRSQQAKLPSLLCFLARSTRTLDKLVMPRKFPFPPR